MACVTGEDTGIPRRSGKPDGEASLPGKDRERIGRGRGRQLTAAGSDHLSRERKECEDDEGNVYTKKTFEDLAKQGIIRPAAGLAK